MKKKKIDKIHLLPDILIFHSIHSKLQLFCIRFEIDIVKLNYQIVSQKMLKISICKIKSISRSTLDSFQYSMSIQNGNIHQLIVTIKLFIKTNFEGLNCVFHKSYYILGNKES